MSLAIDPDKVKEVLLIDGWHLVKKKSFDIDSYEFVGGSVKGIDGRMEDGYTLLGGGQDDHIASHGFRFWDGKGNICGPMTSILAVRV